MLRNVEIKARLSDARIQKRLAESHCGDTVTLLHQEDVFFNCEAGRLKLRIFEANHGELIFYQRSDQSGPKTSNYVISTTTDPSSLLDALRLAYGQKAVVRKKRRLFLSGRTRIHLDHVESLGDFLELEVVLGPDDDLDGGAEEANDWMEKLEIHSDMLIDRAYVDLLQEMTS